MLGTRSSGKVPDGHKCGYVYKATCSEMLFANSQKLVQGKKGGERRGEEGYVKCLVHKRDTLMVTDGA